MRIITNKSRLSSPKNEKQCAPPESQTSTEPSDSSRTKARQIPRQELLECIVGMVYKFCRTKALILDNCGGTFPIENACSQLTAL